jgi:hypothetical protein
VLVERRVAGKVAQYLQAAQREASALQETVASHERGLTRLTDSNRALIGHTHREAIARIGGNSNTFRAVADHLLEWSTSELRECARGRITMPVRSRALDIQRQIMRHFATRMDAVSYCDLELWEHIVRESRTSTYREFAKEYYQNIRGDMLGKGTIVTRLFVFERHHLRDPEQLAVLAGVLAKHYEDEIAFALTFMDNIQPDTRDWIGRSDVRKDFALHDGSSAATFFSGDGDRKFEAIFEDAGGSEQIENQRTLHRTLVKAAVMYSPAFEGKVRGQFSAAEWQEITGSLAKLRHATFSTIALDGSALGGPEVRAQSFGVPPVVWTFLEA